MSTKIVIIRKDEPKRVPLWDVPIGSVVGEIEGIDGVGKEFVYIVAMGGVLHNLTTNASGVADYRKMYRDATCIVYDATITVELHNG